MFPTTDPPVHAPRELTAGKPFAETRLDDVLTDLQSGGGRVVCRIDDPASGRRLELKFDDAFRECVVFNPPHREAFCIEPYTARRRVRAGRSRHRRRFSRAAAGRIIRCADRLVPWPNVIARRLTDEYNDVERVFGPAGLTRWAPLLACPAVEPPLAASTAGQASSGALTMPAGCSP